MSQFSEQQCTITLTERAAQHLTKMVLKSGKGVLIALEKAGCAGYMYRIEVLQSLPEHCMQIRVNQSLTLWVPYDSVPRLHGSQLDYQQSQLEKKAVFNNPNVTLACGCGDSVELIQAEKEA